MDFDFTPEQDVFRAVVREFARAEIAPHAGDWDQCGQFPCEVVTKMGALGLFGLLVPEDLGGSGADFTTFCTAIEELAAVDSSTAITLSAGVGLGIGPIMASDKATRFVNQCDAFSIPLLFLADVPGFMIGRAVEREGIIRHGAKMITAVSEATVPKISVIIRKAYGAGLYAMCGPAFGPDACLALPTAKIAVMGPEPAVNAVYANKIATIEDPAESAAFVAERIADYEADVDLVRLASDLVIDAVVPHDELHDELVARFHAAANKDRFFSDRRHGNPPV